MSEIITQTKLILPGGQLEHYNLIDVNDKYFIYCSTFSAFIFNITDFKLKSILGDNPDKFISAISLNQSPSEELLAIYYPKAIMIYNLCTNKYLYSIPFIGLKSMKFNKNSTLLILNNKGELYMSKLTYNRANNILNFKIDEGICTFFKWYPFNTNDFAYSNDKNKVYYSSILKNINIDNNSPMEHTTKIKDKYIHIKDEENFTITNMEFYDLDENYKYLLVGTSTSKIFLLDLINFEIANKFNKYGKTPIQYLFWLINQPGSFISINEKNGRYIKWNVSRSNYISIGKISDYSLISCAKFDKNSKFLTTNGNGEVEIIDIFNNKNIFQIKDNHYQCIYDLKINPNNDDLFITASFDGNIKLYSIKNNFGLIYNFNTNNNLNNLKAISSLSEENNNITSSRLGGNYCINNSDKNHVVCLKWAPNHSNLFASGDSFLNLRIFDISIKKQIILYKCPINGNNKNQKNKNILIHGIDWNSKDNILVGLNISIFLFSFVINDNNNNNKNNNDKYSLILVNEIKINSLVYNLVFEKNNDNIIAPCDNGVIYFYHTTKDKLGKIIDINPTPSKEISGHSKSVYQVLFNNSNTLMASSSDDMKIGLYDLEKSQSTPRSKLTLTITKFLVGQENQIRQLLFLVDDTLISGSWNGVICIWNTQKCQLMHKLSENQSDVYGLSVSKKNPFIFVTGGRDAIIRFWNLNYKLKIQDLLQVDKNNKKDIENFIRKYYIEEDYDTFFNLLNNNINKEKELIDIILKKEDYLKKQFSKFNLNKNDLGINNKIDFSLKQSDRDNIIDNLIKESAIIGEWKLFCELCILKNRWEDAICFAPKVSLKYWEQLMNKYEEFINSDDYINSKNTKENYFNTNNDLDDIKLIGLLNGKNYKQIIDYFIKQKDYQNALMIWLMKKSQKNENIDKKDSNNDKDLIELELDQSAIEQLISNENERNKIYSDIKKNLNEDENIKKIFEEESLIYLKDGKRIKAIINYMYFEDKFLFFKTIYKSFFIELGYLLCNFDDKENGLKDINNIFILSLYEKYKSKINDNIISQLINKMFDNDYKNNLYQKIENKEQNGVLNFIPINKSESFSIFENNDLTLYKNTVIKNKEDCFDKLAKLFLDKDNKIEINESEIKDISLKLSEYIKFLILLKIEAQELNQEIQNDIIYSVIFLECLNYNYKSLICLIIEYFISRNIIDIKKETNNDILIFIFCFVNYIQNNFKENKTIKEYKFNFIHQQKYKLISSFCNKNSINIDKFNKIRKMLDFNDFYKCDTNEMKLFYLQNEIYPKKVNKDDNLSTFSNTNIRSNTIRLASGNYASQSEFLEMTKFLYIKS